MSLSLLSVCYMKYGEGCYWPDPVPPLLLVLDPALEAPVAAVLAEPAASYVPPFTCVQFMYGCLFVCALLCLSSPYAHSCVHSLFDQSSPSLNVPLGIDVYSPEHNSYEVSMEHTNCL